VAFKLRAEKRKRKKDKSSRREKDPVVEEGAVYAKPWGSGN
jgi:hypothetical protein